MKQRKGSTHGRKVWRMTEAAPQGEFVEVTEAEVATHVPSRQHATPAAPGAQPEVSHGSWLESSFELLRGTEVHEGPDTVPDDLFDELFAPAPKAPVVDR